MRWSSPFRTGSRWWIPGLMMIVSGLSCVRVEVPREEYSRTRLTLARDIHGVQVQWMSREDRRYALMYRDPESGDPRWRPMPDYSEVRGTGRMITVKLKDPAARKYEYRLQTLVGVDRDQLR